MSSDWIFLTVLCVCCVMFDGGLLVLVVNGGRNNFVAAVGALVAIMGIVMAVTARANNAINRHSSGESFIEIVTSDDAVPDTIKFKGNVYRLQTE